jgi:hypothetical protein
MQAVHHLLFGKTSLDSLSVCVESLVLLATSLLLAVACQIQPIQRTANMAWLLLAHAVQLEHKARCTLTVGGLCDASMLTSRTFLLPWLLLALGHGRVASLVALSRDNSSIAQLWAEVKTFQRQCRIFGIVTKNRAAHSTLASSRLPPGGQGACFTRRIARAGGAGYRLRAVNGTGALDLPPFSFCRNGVYLW